jgi:hypothetical protein
MSAGIVFIGTAALSLHPRGFAFINVALVTLWLFFAWRIGRQYREIVASGRPPVTEG